MAEYVGTFKLSVMNPDKMIFEGNVTTLFLSGNEGEFELLPFHYPVLSLLKKGEVVIDWKYSIAIKRGLIKFFKNDCVIMVELDD
jgi:F-type H+-transporting ATPase subunit epsilon